MFVNKCEGRHTTKNFPTVRTIKRILEDARRFPVLRPKVASKRAEVFCSATTERAARVNLATKMDVEVLKPVLASQRNSKKETKKVFCMIFLKDTFFSFDRIIINTRHTSTI